MQHHLKIILMGPQGSGKGTQAQRLSDHFSIPAISMGQLIRDEIASGSESGERLKQITSAGELISDQDAAELLKQRLDKPDAKNGYILDGYPRNQAQLNAFNFDEPTDVIVLDLSRDTSLQRLGDRLTCSTTGHVTMRSSNVNPGDACEDGGTWYVREDDTPEAINRRLDIYEQETQEVINAYDAQGVVRHVDAEGDIDEVFQRILNTINS